MKRLIYAIINASLAVFFIRPASADSTKMYWTDVGAGKIQRANLNGSNVEDLVTTGLNVPHGIAVDLHGEKIYWTDVGSGKIQRANLDGSSVEDLVTGLDYPYGIALDIFSSKMYWTDKDADKIQRANLDGSNVEVVISPLEPSPIVLDLSYDGKIYWAQASSIYRANPDGSEIELLEIISMFPLSAIDLDLESGKMYFPILPWGDILRGNIDGGDIETLATDLGTLMGISLDLNSSKLYWTNQGDGKIQRANLDGSNIEDIVTGLGEPTGLATGRINGLPVTPDHLEFEVRLNGGSPPSQNIGIRNFSEEPLNWTATTDADWLSIDVNSGLCPAVGDSNIITVDVNVAGLGVGTYEANIVVFDGGSPKPVIVELQVIGPIIGLSDNEFYFSVLEGDDFPANQVLGIQNTGGGVLNWQVSETCQRLSVEPNCGSSTTEMDDVNIIADINGLELGIYTCELTVADPCAENSPQIVNVTFNYHGYHDGNKMYWTDLSRDKIQRANLDGTEVEDVVTGLQRPSRIAISVSLDKMYWTDSEAGKVQRANLDGSNVEDLVTGLNYPHGIELDVIGGKMYWTNNFHVRRSNLDGTDIEPIAGIETDDIALDISGGKIYWIEELTILRADLNGSNIEELIQIGGESILYAIDLDLISNKIYWSYYSYGSEYIRRSDLDGSNSEIVFKGDLGTPVEIALDPAGDKIYVADNSNGTILRVELGGTNIEELVTGLGYNEGLALAIQPCDYVLAGDLNDDCVVNFYDFAEMTSNWLIDCIVDPCDPACIPK
jgi:DNA-binding beta-propeller fold protein YncE